VIAGLDEPLVIEDISVQDMMGVTRTGDLTLLVLDAYTEESLEGGEGGAIYPQDSADIYLTLIVEVEGPANSVEWLVRNGQLESSGQVYPAERFGLRVGEGGMLEGWLLIFPIPRESEYGSYRLGFPDGQEIDLRSFFE
jgi:hypothetical protein